MVIIPIEKSNSDVKTEFAYVCPTCMAQTTDSKFEGGWVACPMAKGQYICVGCCIDLQTVAKSETFESHPYFNDFNNVAKKYRKDTFQMRNICLNHQIEVCNFFLNYKGSKSVSNKEFMKIRKDLIDLVLEIAND